MDYELLKRPVFTASIAMLLLGLALLGIRWSETRGVASTVIEVARLKVDTGADRIDGLIQPVPFSLPAERATLWELLPDALSGETGDDGAGLDAPALADAALADLHERLTVLAAPSGDGFEIVLSRRFFADNREDLPRLEKIAAEYVAFRQEERRGQQEQAAAWADRLIAAHEGRVRRLKAARAVAGIGGTGEGARNDSPSLFGLFADATREAQADMLGGMRRSVDAESEALAPGPFGRHYRALTRDIEKLERLSSQVSQPNDEGAGDVETAEQALARVKADVRAFNAVDSLSNPAATVITKATSTKSVSLANRWFAIALFALLSLALALALAAIVFRHQEVRAKTQATGRTIFDDPYWPMGEQRQLREFQ